MLLMGLVQRPKARNLHQDRLKTQKGEKERKRKEKRDLVKKDLVIKIKRRKINRRDPPTMEMENQNIDGGNGKIAKGLERRCEPFISCDNVVYWQLQILTET